LNRASGLGQRASELQKELQSFKRTSGLGKRTSKRASKRALEE
jgi:hypothetical protein